MPIFDTQKSLNINCTMGEMSGAMYSLSNNGWIDMELFHLWFTKHFLQHAVSAKPFLLLVDGYTFN